METVKGEFSTQKKYQHHPEEFITLYCKHIEIEKITDSKYKKRTFEKKTNIFQNTESKMTSLKDIFRICAVLIIFTIPLAISAPVQSRTRTEIHLSDFGYSQSKHTASFGLLDSKTWTGAIINFRRFIGLKLTDELDAKTLEQMTYTQCGVKDKAVSNSRSKRYIYIHDDGRPMAKNLTYNISRYSYDLSKQQIDEEIIRAFDVWSRYVDLTFIRKHEGYVDIEIAFERFDHGDGTPFDGPGGVLAHAGVPEVYTPGFTFPVHFDDSERWTINEDWGKDLFQIAVHEIGHVLGLDHSKNRFSVMFPQYHGFNSKYRLDRDDIQVIKALYS